VAGRARAPAIAGKQVRACGTLAGRTPVVVGKLAQRRRTAGKLQAQRRRTMNGTGAGKRQVLGGSPMGLVPIGLEKVDWPRTVIKHGFPKSSALHATALLKCSRMQCRTPRETKYKTSSRPNF
jgi:hypothetical protein